MGQYAEGQRLQGSDGKIYVVRNGVPVSEAPSPLIPNPKLPGELTGQTLSNQRTQQEITQAQATAEANTTKAKAEAQSAQLAAKQAQEQWNINHPQANGTEGLSGPAYMQFLQKSDPGRAAYIQGLAEGRVPFPGGQMMRSPAGQALLTQVMRADPTIDATNYTTRAAARKNAATGKLSNSDNALITAIGHASMLNQLVPDVFGSKITPFNSIANSIDSNLFGGKQPEYDQNARLLGSEVSQAYGQGTGGERDASTGDFASWRATGQKQDNIQHAVELMASKLAANRAQFAYGNGQLGKPDFMLLPEQTRNELMAIPGGHDIAAKYFGGIPSLGHGNGPSGPSGGGGITPPPTGPQGSFDPSSGGVSDSPDPQSAQFWEGAARQGMPYTAALAQWQRSLPPGAASTPPDPKAYSDVVTYMAKNPNVDYHPVQSILRQQMSPLSGVMNDVAQTPSGAFAGHYFNDLSMGAINKLAGDRGAMFNAVSDQQNPKSSFLGDALGMAGGAALAGKGVGAAADGLAGAPVIGSYLRGIGVNPAAGLTGIDARLAQTQAAIRRNVTGDMISSGVTGANNNPDHPVLGAALNMGAMATGNLVGRYAIAPAAAAIGDTAAGQAVVNGGRKLGGMFGRPAAPFAPPAPLDPAATRVVGLGNDAVSNLQGNLQDAARLKLPYSLADGDPRLRYMLGSAARKSLDVRTLAENTLGPRQLGQGERAIGQINSNLAPVGDIPSIMAAAQGRAQEASAPLYAKAMEAPTPIGDPHLTEMLNTPAGAQASRHAYNIALNRGENPAELSFATAPDGSPITNANPNWKTLQYIKMGLDKVVTDNKNPVTGKLDLSDPATRALNDLRGRFVGRLGELNPDYAAANQAYQGGISQGTAAQQGANATGINVTPQATEAALGNVGPNAPFFQQGMASQLADNVTRQQFSGNPYNLVAGSLGRQAKLNTVFPKGAPDFLRAANLEGDMGKTYQEALGGSQTQPRSEADKAFDKADMAVDLGTSALTGMPPLGIAMTGARGLVNKWKYGLGKQAADAIGPQLMNLDPHANLAALNQWIQQNAARKAYLNQVGAGATQLGAGMFGAPAISWASQN